MPAWALRLFNFSAGNLYAFYASGNNQWPGQLKIARHHNLFFY